MTGRKSLITDFTSGPILKPLVFFSLPFMLSNALQVLYTLVDMYFVGHYLDVASLSAVTNASRLVDFFVAVCMGLALGGQIYIAQLIGQKRRGERNLEHDVCLACTEHARALNEAAVGVLDGR